MDSWCVIPLISGDATAPPQVSRASPTALLSPVTYLGGFFKKIPKKAFSFLVSSHHSVMERGGETADWKAVERGGLYSRNWWQTHEKVDPAEVRQWHEPGRRVIRSASGRSSHERSGQALIRRENEAAHHHGGDETSTSAGGAVLVSLFNLSFWSYSSLDSLGWVFFFQQCVAQKNLSWALCL